MLIDSLYCYLVLRSFHNLLVHSIYDEHFDYPHLTVFMLEMAHFIGHCLLSADIGVELHIFNAIDNIDLVTKAVMSIYIPTQ